MPVFSLEPALGCQSRLPAPDGRAAAGVCRHSPDSRGRIVLTQHHLSGRTLIFLLLPLWRLLVASDVSQDPLVPGLGFPPGHLQVWPELWAPGGICCLCSPTRCCFSLCFPIRKQISCSASLHHGARLGYFLRYIPHDWVPEREATTTRVSRASLTAQLEGARLAGASSWVQVIGG